METFKSSGARDKTRILYISPASCLGGPVNSLKSLLEGLQREQYEPFVLRHPNYCSEFDSILSGLKVNIIDSPIVYNNWLRSTVSGNQGRHKLRIGAHLLRDIQNGFKVYRYIKKYNIDIVHTNIELLLFGALGALFARKPHVWHIRAEIGCLGAINHEFGCDFALRVIHSLSNKVIVNSRATMKPWKKSNILTRVELIHNGVDTPLNKDGGHLRALLGSGGGKTIVATIGELRPEEGIDSFIKAAASIRKVRDDCLFVIIGKMDCDRDYTRSLVRDVQDYGLADVTYFLGFRTDIIGLLPDIDILIHPEHNGSWSRSVLEAMAAGIPVIGVEDSLESDFVEHKVSGILVESSTQIEGSLKILLENRELREAMGRNARLRAQLFSAKRYSEKVEKVYKDIQAESTQKL